MGAMVTSRKLVDKKDANQPTTPIRVGESVFGQAAVPLIAGPCAVENPAQLAAVAQTLRKLGISCMRAGAFKPRTSPYTFQGLGDEALSLLAEIRKTHQLAVVSEVMGVEHIAQARDVFDCFQVGSRNMQNFELLKALGKEEKPVLLKRGFAATLDEFLNAAEYIAAGGNTQIILCERGIRSFDPQTRNVLDLACAILLKEKTHLPVIVDPSHATGQRSLVGPAAKAAVAAGLDGLIIEAHPHPEQSVSDADQALGLDDLETLVPELDRIARAVGRTIRNAGVRA